MIIITLELRVATLLLTVIHTGLIWATKSRHGGRILPIVLIVDVRIGRDCLLIQLSRCKIIAFICFLSLFIFVIYMRVTAIILYIVNYLSHRRLSFRSSFIKGRWPRFSLTRLHFVWFIIHVKVFFGWCGSFSNVQLGRTWRLAARCSNLTVRAHECQPLLLFIPALTRLLFEVKQLSLPFLSSCVAHVIALLFLSEREQITVQICLTLQTLLLLLDGASFERLRLFLLIVEARFQCLLLSGGWLTYAGGRLRILGLLLRVRSHVKSASYSHEVQGRVVVVLIFSSLVLCRDLSWCTSSSGRWLGFGHRLPGETVMDYWFSAASLLRWLGDDIGTLKSALAWGSVFGLSDIIRRSWCALLIVDVG